MTELSDWPHCELPANDCTPKCAKYIPQIAVSSLFLSPLFYSVFAFIWLHLPTNSLIHDKTACVSKRTNWCPEFSLIEISWLHEKIFQSVLMSFQVGLTELALKEACLLDVLLHHSLPLPLSVGQQQSTTSVTPLPPLSRWLSPLCPSFLLHTSTFCSSLV